MCGATTATVTGAGSRGAPTTVAAVARSTRTVTPSRPIGCRARTGRSRVFFTASRIFRTRRSRASRSDGGSGWKARPGGTSARIPSATSAANSGHRWSPRPGGLARPRPNFASYQGPLSLSVSGLRRRRGPISIGISANRGAPLSRRLAGGLVRTIAAGSWGCRRAPPTRDPVPRGRPSPPVRRAPPMRVDQRPRHESRRVLA